MSRSRKVDGMDKGMEDWLATRGQKKFKRDCKAALVLFNYGGDNAIAKIPNNKTISVSTMVSAGR